ncbi:unnamed protein product [Amoebophrya sp. A25]|nr:unnamed protein product [Amoebophrya sp. A25]|eukprot:GSA25T00019373001.1
MSDKIKMFHHLDNAQQLASIPTSDKDTMSTSAAKWPPRCCLFQQRCFFHQLVLSIVLGILVAAALPVLASRRGEDERITGVVLSAERHVLETRTLENVSDRIKATIVLRTLVTDGMAAKMREEAVEDTATTNPVAPASLTEKGVEGVNNRSLHESASAELQRSKDLQQEANPQGPPTVITSTKLDECMARALFYYKNGLEFIVAPGSFLREYHTALPVTVFFAGGVEAPTALAVLDIVSQDKVEDYIKKGLLTTSYSNFLLGTQEFQESFEFLSSDVMARQVSRQEQAALIYAAPTPVSGLLSSIPSQVLATPTSGVSSLKEEERGQDAGVLEVVEPVVKEKRSTSGVLGELEPLVKKKQSSTSESDPLSERTSPPHIASSTTKSSHMSASASASSKKSSTSSSSGSRSHSSSTATTCDWEKVKKLDLTSSAKVGGFGIELEGSTVAFVVAAVLCLTHLMLYVYLLRVLAAKQEGRIILRTRSGRILGEALDQKQTRQLLEMLESDLLAAQKRAKKAEQKRLDLQENEKEQEKVLDLLLI